MTYHRKLIRIQLEFLEDAEIIFHASCVGSLKTIITKANQT